MCLLVILFCRVFKIYMYWSVRGVAHLNLLRCFKNCTISLFRITSSADFFKDMYDKYKDKRYVGFYEYFQPILLIKDPDLIKDITLKDFHSFEDHHNFVPSADLHSIWSKNLYSMSTQQGWNEMRAILTPFFTSSKLRAMFPLMKECCDNFLKSLHSNEGTKIVEIKDFIFRYTIDVIAKIGYGVTCNSFENENNEFLKMTESLMNYTGLEGLTYVAYVTFPSVMKKLNIQPSRIRASVFFRKLFLNVARMRDTNGTDLVSLLIKNGFLSGKRNAKLSLVEDDFVGHLLFLLIAAVETTAHVLAYIFHELVQHPKVQLKLYEELRRVLKENNGSIDYEGITSMTYLDNVISECLRMHPVQAAHDRKCTKSYTIKAKLPGESDIYLKEGDWIWMPPEGVQKDPKYYMEPEKFDPDRFSAENKHMINQFTFLTFGVGPRSCIGQRFALMEMKLIVAEVLQRYEFESCNFSDIERYHDSKIWIRFISRM